MSETTELMRAPQETELTVEQIVDRMEKVRDLMKRAMVEGVDYGVIPGTDGKKKPLLQPGAEKLAMMFRLAASYKIVQTDLQDGHREFSVTCRLTHIPSDNFCGEATASCSSLETKYRYRGGSRKCPMCSKETIIKGKAEYGGGFLCFKKKGGCGAKFAEDDQAITGQSEIKTENPDIAGEFNTIVQMAQKRAFLRAIRQATASSELFTQDVGEVGGFDDHDDAHRPVDVDANKNRRRQEHSGEENQDAPPPEESASLTFDSPWQELMHIIVKRLGVGKNDWQRIDKVVKWCCPDLTVQKCHGSAEDSQRVIAALTEKNGNGMPLEMMAAEAEKSA